MVRKKSFVRNLLQRPIAYQPVFARIWGVCPAVLLSQALYWQEVAGEREWHKTNKEWCDETGLTRCEFETARKKLSDAGVLEYQLKGNPAKNWYRVNEEKLWEILTSFLDCRIPANKIAGNPQTSFLEPCKQDCSEPANKIAGNQRSLNSESTTEISRDIDRDALEPREALQATAQLAAAAKPAPAPISEFSETRSAPKTPQTAAELAIQLEQERESARQALLKAGFRSPLIENLLHKYHPARLITSLAFPESPLSVKEIREHLHARAGTLPAQG